MHVYSIPFLYYSRFLEKISPLKTKKKKKLIKKRIKKVQQQRNKQTNKQTKNRYNFHKSNAEELFSSL